MKSTAIHDVLFFKWVKFTPFWSDSSDFTRYRARPVVCGDKPEYEISLKWREGSGRYHGQSYYAKEDLVTPILGKKISLA